MFSSVVWPTWSELFHGEITFKQIGEMFSAIFNELLGHEYFLDIWTNITSYVKSFVLPAFVILAALSLTLAFFGRRILPFAKFVAFFLLGFTLGVSLIAPLLTSASFEVMPLIIGLVMGLLLALLSKSLYIVLYILAFAYSSYMIFMGGQLLPENVVSFTKDNMIISLSVVCVTIVLVVLLRKPIEVVGTSILGGYLFSLCIDRILYELLSIERIEAVSIILMVLVGLLGFVKQLKGKKSRKSKKNKKAKKSD